MTISHNSGELKLTGHQTSSGYGWDFNGIEGSIYEQAATSLNISRTKIEDVYPCTPLQEALITLSTAGSGAYVKRIVLSLDPDIDLEKFRSAVEDVAKSTAILRTRIIQCSPVGFVQAVLSERVRWSEEDSLEEYLKRSETEKWGVGDPLLQYTLVRDGQGTTRWFVWTIHHAVYDGWSFPLMVAEVGRRYADNPVIPTPPYKDFVKHIMRKNHDGNHVYWLSALEGSRYAQFPALPKVSYMPAADTTLEQHCPPVPKIKGITRTALLRGALAVVLSRFNDSNDVIFGTIVSGRNEPIAGIRDLIGPTVATVPVRVKIDGDETIQGYLDTIQKHAQMMGSFDQWGLHEISKVSSDARQACSFQTILVVQPGDDAHTVKNDLGVWRRPETDVGRSAYALTIQCFLNKTGIRMVAAFDSFVLDKYKAQKMLEQFSFITQQLARAHQSQLMADLGAAVSPQDLRDIWGWNSTVPPAVEACVHDLISLTAKRQPDAPAICAWDGNLTYRQIDHLSTRLAYHLVNLGVTSGMMIPLCFEKSMWTSVAMLSVMKAGGVSIAMDTTQPEDRLKSIIGQVNARLIISSDANELMAKRLGNCDVVIVGKKSLASLEKLPSSTAKPPLPTVHSDQSLMVLFTSGSTGSPKGTIITHSSFSTAIKHHGPVFGIGPSERVFDFASYSFDIAWFNVLQALSHGACLCVPSESERKNDLEESLSRFQATFIFLTPSVARLLNAERLPYVKCIALGGEPQKWSDFQSWSAHVKKLSVYGPAECTVVSAATDASILQSGDMLIGRGLASANWILTTTDNPALAPVGAVGELWIEGPLVGKGYLNNPAQRAAAFVEDPAWLLHGGADHPGRRGRLYKTGDLVRYNFDGTLAFVGRKDTQVKIRGQRVELSEVEYHIQQFLKSGCSNTFDGLVVAEVITPEGSKNSILVAFIYPGTACLGREGPQLEEKCAAAVHDLVVGLDERLAEVVPSYMIPNAFIPVVRMPMTNNGKTDRRQLREIGRMTYQDYTTTSALYEKLVPSTDIEKNLLEIWVEVLNLNVDAVSTNMSFTRIGGDSITAMQVVSRCRARNISITVADVLRAQTIQKIAMLCTSVTYVPPSAEEEAEGTTWTLSPIQQMFFEFHPHGLNHFNQGFLLKFRRPVSNDAVRTALQAVVDHHSMLRARFQRNEKGEWEQYVSRNDPSVFAFSEHSVQTKAEVHDIMQARQGTLDISNGPVFAADLFIEEGGAQFLFLVAHHLVIDLVSWRILWYDIENAIKLGKTSSSRMLSFRTWCGLQQDEGQSLSLAQVLPFSIAKSNWEYWGLSADENTDEGSKQYNRHLDIETSNLLLGNSNHAFRTEVTDILVATLIYTFRQTFPDRQPPAVFLEGHGREPLGNLEVDLSETVGWFTMLHPLQVPLEITNDILDCVKLAKDIRRGIPGKGRPYFSYRYHSVTGRQDLKDHNIPELTLNFTGVYQQLENVNGLFQLEDQSDGSGRSLSMSSATKRFGFVEVIVGVVKGRISISFGVHQKMQHQPQLEQWTDRFAQQLKLTVHNLAGRSASFTPSDFPLLSLSFDRLDTLLEKTLGYAGISVDAVDDIYPCTSLQEGILLSINKGTASYANYFIWECAAKSDMLISPIRLEAAWRSVVAHHSILSTVFVEQLDEGNFVQVLLREHVPRILFIKSYSKPPADVLREQNRPAFTLSEPEHVFTICQASNGDVACRLDVSHALIDAASISILVDDIAKAYREDSLSMTASFGQYIQHLSSMPKSMNLTFWTQSLANVQRCDFPTTEALGRPQIQSNRNHGRITLPASVTSDIYSFCQNRGITRSVFVQIVWALVLSQYTGLRDVCFGYMVSSRDAPINHIENMVGPLINILISRVDLDQSINHAFSTMFEQSVEQLAFQHTSLAEIQHQLGLGAQPLFNTAITVRESRWTEHQKEEDIHFREVESADPDEFDITLATETNGPSTQISVSYQNSSVGPVVARDVVDTVCRAIEHLLTINMQDTNISKAKPDVKDLDNRSLYDAFFAYLTGVNEDAGVEFWRQEFEGSEVPQFPILPSPTYTPCADNMLHHEIQGLEWLETDFTASTSIRATWAILAARYSNSSETTFGTVTKERHPASQQGIESIAGSTMATVPVRVVLDYDRLVDELLEKIQQQEVDMMLFEQMGQQRIQRINEELKQAYQFQTLLIVQPIRKKDSGPAQSVRNNLCVRSENDENDADLNNLVNFNEYALIMKFQLQENGLQLLVNFDSTVINRPQANHIVYQFEHILRQILSSSDSTTRVHDISVVSAQDLNDIWQHNVAVPMPVEACVHDLIMTAAQRQPHAPAVCAWDDELTYRQLDELSTKLAHQLIRLGLKPNMTVLLCFEKSAWTPVAMLGVMKAGGVSINTDITQPEDRLRTIVDQAVPQLIVSSVSHESLANRLSQCKVVTVGKKVQDLESTGSQLPLISPENRLYVVFTSGTTGTPKGVIITHSNFCSAIKYQQALGFTSTSRVYDFASYAFDVSWSNALHTLTAGGCLCIPSDEERKEDIAKSIRNLKANYADLTPTVAQFLTPANIPLFGTLNLGGEALIPGLFDHWPQNIRIINAYGPAECTVVSTYTEVHRAKQDRGIGTAIGTVTWVVDPSGKELAAIGTIGELWIEGPLVGQGYLNDTVRTKAAFIRDPPWLLRGATDYPGRHGRLYRTGDLVRYNTDGSLNFIGRKDTQVKIHGQRVELGEVEHHIWSSLSAYSPAFDGILVAEMITPQGSDHSKLVVFIYWGENYPETEPVDRIIAGLNERLARVVPAHMIPSAFIPVQSVPMTASGKIDRRRLRQTYASLSWERIAAFGSSLSKQNVELTLQERQIRSLWARVLNLDPDSIGADDNFLRIGGDSITAMKLIGAARELGLSLKMADIFTHPRLDELAQLLQVNTNNTEQAVTPFSLLGANVDKESTLRKVTSLCEVSSDEIEDIFGCTPLQEGLLALTARRSGDYIAQFVYKLSQTIDINRFIETWMQIIATTPILRTRIVDLPGTGLVQVLFKSQTSWLSANDLEAYLQADKQRPMELGTILTRFGLVTNQDSDSGITYFVWTIHHALYDGWSMPLLLDAMNRAYYGEPLPTWTPFQLFIKHVNDMDQQGSIHFWREQFKGLDAPQFPLLPSSTYHPRADSVLDHEIQGINWHGSDFTASTVIRTAWAILAARYTNANEAVFGAISTGRQAAIQGIEHLMGPTFVTVPVRIVIDWASCLKDLLQKTQQQATQMVPFEQMGLQNIQRISKDAEQSCQFQTLLLVQPERKNSDKATLFHQQQNLDNDGGKVIGADDFSTYALIIECQLEEQGMHLHISFDSAVMDRSQAKRIGRQFEHLLRQVHSEVNGAVSIHQLEAASEQDLRDIWGWNKTVPTAVDSSVHVLIAEIMNQRPKAPAICAWDGELTYEQLDKFSTQLAHRLVKLGVESEMIPLIFEKSKWMPVAMLGTMKAGGVSIAIDATLPQDSLQRIINQAAPKFIVSSSGNETLANQLGGGCKVITVHDGQPNNFDSNDVQLPSVSPNSGLYVVFTSGTTGTPKGVAITHRNFCSAMKHQIESLGFTSQSRVFDFSSYAFDVVWSNLLYTLYVGGCLCIPSDLDRKQDLANSIRSLKATYLDLTPSTAQLLSHSEIPGITNVNLGGETLTEAAFAHWPKHVRLTNTYGPAECTINSTSTEIDRTGKQDRRGIGTAIGSVTWVVANDGRELAAIGAIGELWLEGPIIGQGYFNNLAQTSEAFIENPAWLLRGGGSDDYPGRHGRLYKTGDLVQYNVDGSLTFIGRKDTQVKIHGQRVELGEVEHQILRLLNGTYSKKQDIANPASTFNGMVVAEVIIARDSDQPALVAFIYPGETQARSKKECANAVHEIVTALDVRLGEVMPSYMIPSAFIPLDMVPMLSSDKVDRRRLRELGASLTREHIAALSSSSERRAPRTQHELQMQSLWARVLDLDANSISIDDNFMRVGGDSIKAMRLAALAKDEGLSLLVADILRHPRLVELADLVEASCDLVDQTISPFSLLGADIDEPSIRRSVALLCNTDQIQDIFPCTPFQEGLLAMSARREGDYVARFVQELHPEVDVSRFVNAWDKALAMTPILQTRFINLPGRGLLQVVTKQQNTWLSGHDVSTYIQEDKRRIMGLAEALSRTGIVRDHKSGKVFFIWTVHHALYDGWSVTLLFDMVQRIYHGSSSPPLVPFQAFIKYLTEMNNKFAEDFWKKQFMGLETSPFPALSSPTYHPSADQCIRHQIESLPWSSSNFAASTIIRSAWTILAAKRSGASEAVFGALVSGRQAGVPGIEQMLAPTVATVPMRILLNWNHSIAELLHDVQKQAADMIPFEQMGLQRIRRVSEDARQACQFQTLLVVQPKKVGAVGSDLFVESQDLVDAEPDTMANFSTYALTIECQLQEQGMQVSANFDSCVIEKSQVSRMIQQFEHTLHQLLADSSYTTLARDISILSVGDIHDIWQWNATVPALAETCIHDLITDRQRPHANAIDAWDGKLTYQRLDELSTRLAQHLVELGVEPEMMVPLCFEKSMWMAVAMLGVLKAGGVLVPVDVSQAADRARLILDDIQPSVIVTSRKYKDFARQQGYLTIQPEDAVSEDKANLYGAFTKVSVTPRSAAYVIFTSGSTGKPKGVVVEHGAASTSLLAHGAELGLSQTSRFFQFASHSFDACIMEILTTLVYQGCVCVPSDESRLRQLTESINEMAVNTLFLTPSVARLLQPDQLPTLDTLAIGGELVSTSDTERWMHLSRLLEVYGPTECAILSVMQVLTGKQVPPQTIGRAIGSVAWVVDPENHNNLVPVGAVGELLLEGNILARGYLNNLARTTAAFVEDPPWLLRGGGEQLGRHGRLYKTGDLVRYNEDGTLVCIGRKDTQVKIRGQRVELGEVEYHMRRLINSVHLKHHNAMDDADPSLDILIAAEVITPKDNSQPTLVAFIFPGKTYLRPGDECAAVVRDMVAGLDERLANVLPPHMIPNAYIPLESMLTTTTGKTDRRRLRDIGNSLSRLELASMNAQSNLPKRIPVSDVERKLQQVWARTLNVTTEIGLDDNFFSLGGDSISAMLVSVAARSHGLHVPVNDIMLNNTIAKLASALRAPKSMAHLPVTTIKDVGSRFSLSPIQQFHFDTRPDGPDLLDLPFYLRLTEYKAPHAISDALHALIERHPMLRARFCRDPNGLWAQYVCENTKESLLFRHFENTSESQKAAAIADCRASIDVERGPLFVAALFEDDDEQTLFLSAHHLVIDFVSWRVLFQDIEDFMKSHKFISSPSTSFQEWCIMQHDYASTNLEPEVALNYQPSYPPLDYWDTEEDQPDTEVYVRKQFFLEESTSAAVLGSCSDRLGVRPHEFMMAALLYSYSRVFQDRVVPPVFTEGHGRGAWDESIDLSQTVGWFTTMFPVQVNAKEGDDVLDFVLKTKESLRNMPRQGWSYFASKYLNKRGREIFQNDPIEINFNFLGRFQQLERESSLMEAMPLPADCKPSGMAPIKTVGVFDVTIIIERGQIQADFKYNKRVPHHDKIEAWIRAYEKTVIDVTRTVQSSMGYQPR